MWDININYIQDKALTNNGIFKKPLLPWRINSKNSSKDSSSSTQQILVGTSQFCDQTPITLAGVTGSCANYAMSTQQILSRALAHGVHK